MLSSTAKAVALLGLGTVGLGSVGLAACSGRVEDLPDDLRAALDREESLLERARATLAAHPGLSLTLLAIVADHEAHLTELRRLGGLDPLPASSGDPSLSPSPSAPSVPGSAPEAVAALAESESGASADAREACLQAQGDRAGTFASIGASEASHAFLLTSVASGAT